LISAAVDSNILTLRNPSLSATGMISLLQRLAEDGLALAKEQARLNSNYNFIPDIKISEIFEASQTLRNAGTFKLKPLSS